MSKALRKDSYPVLLKKIRNEIDTARKKIDRARALAYWNVGKYISGYLNENGRAGYGKRLYSKLSKDLDFSERTLQQAVKFHREFPIPHARAQLPWAHSKLLLTVHDEKLRDRLAASARRNDLTTRQLAREIIKTKEVRGGFKPPPTSITSAPSLIPRRGGLNIYQAIASPSVPTPKGRVLIDQGFNAKRLVKRSEFRNVRGGLKPPPTVVKSRKEMSFTYRAYVEKIIDGDTLWATVDLGFNEFITQKLRLRGIDCPELATAAGKKAKRFVKKVLTNNKQQTTNNNKSDPIIICSSKSDKYDRYLADVFYGKEEKYLNQELLDKGLAGAYSD